MIKDKRHIILIVDDNPDILGMLFDVLDAKDYQTRIAKDANRAGEIIKAEIPDLILLDIMMPGMNGFEFCSRLKADKVTRSIPVIFMTALSETVNKIRGFELGASDYIIKPFLMEEVLARIKTHLKLKQCLDNELEIKKLKERLADLALHELKAPLNDIVSASKTIKDFAMKNQEEVILKKAILIEESALSLFKALDSLAESARVFDYV